MTNYAHMDHVKIYRERHPLVLNYQTAKWGFEGELAQCIYSSKLEAKSARFRAARAYEAWMKSQPKPLKVRPPKVLRKRGRPKKDAPKQDTPKIIRKRGRPKLDEPKSPRLRLALSLAGNGSRVTHAAQAAGIAHQAVYDGLKRYPHYETQRRVALALTLAKAKW
jgi:hypothetical protein